MDAFTFCIWSIALLIFAAMMKGWKQEMKKKTKKKIVWYLICFFSSIAVGLSPLALYFWGWAGDGFPHYEAGSDPMVPTIYIIIFVTGPVGLLGVAVTLITAFCDWAIHCMSWR